MDDLHDADGAIPARLLQAEDGQYELLIREFQPLPFTEETRIVMLDGTADLALSRKLIGRDDLEILKVNIPLYPGSEIIQLTEPRLPRSSLTSRSGRTTQSGWVKTVLRLAHKEHDQTGAKVLVISHQPFIISLEKTEPPDWMTMRYYGNVRGESLEENEVCILVGVPYPPRDEVNLTASAIWQGESLDLTYEDEWRPFLDVAGANEKGEWWGSTITLPKDPRVRAVWSQVADNELYQALHRIRPIRAARKVYVLTSHPLSPEWQVPVRLISKDELLGNKGKASYQLSDLAERILAQEGWVSRDLIEALAMDNWEKQAKTNIYHLFVKMPIYFLSMYSLGSLTNKCQPFENKDENLTPPTFSPSTIRRWWDSWSQYHEVHEVALKKGGKGAPLRDEFVGDSDQWTDAHIDHLPYEVELRLDGEEVVVDDLPIVAAG